MCLSSLAPTNISVVPQLVNPDWLIVQKKTYPRRNIFSLTCSTVNYSYLYHSKGHVLLSALFFHLPFLLVQLHPSTLLGCIVFLIACIQYSSPPCPSQPPLNLSSTDSFIFSCWCLFRPSALCFLSETFRWAGPRQATACSLEVCLWSRDKV